MAQVHSTPRWVRMRVFQRELGMGDFSGGLNILVAPTELANNESPDLFNVTLDERGGIQPRLGYVKKNGTVYTTSSPPQQLYEWKLNGIVFTQCGTGIFKDNGVSSVYTFSTSARVGFAEFAGNVYVIHPVDGLYWSSDGVTWTAVPGSPKGAVIEPWQNRMIAIGDPNAVTTVYASAIGDPRNWATSTNDRAGTDMAVTNGNATVSSATGAFTNADISKKITIAGVDYHIASITDSTHVVLDANYAGTTATGVAWAISGDGWTNQIREKDSKPLVALKSSSGLDIAGRPGILVFKQDSTYRINDSNNGSYQTIDPTIGACSALAVVNLYEETFVIHTTGVYRTNGVSPFTLVSAKLQPLFDPAQLAFDHPELWCAGARADRVHFSVPKAGQTANSLALEYHPVQGWFVVGDDAVSCYLTKTFQGQALYGGAPGTNGQVWQLQTGGTDNGVAITSRFQTKWIAPAGSIPCRFRRVRVLSLGQFNLYTKLDFDPGQGQLHQVTGAGTATTWNGGTWGTGTWGAQGLESITDYWSLGHGKYISFVITATTTTTLAGQARAGVLAAPTVGAYALYGLTLQFILTGV